MNRIARALNAIRKLHLGGVVAALLLTPSVGQAQETFVLDRAQPSGAPDDGFMVHRAYMHEETRFYATGTLGYAHNPLRKDAVTDNASVQRRIEDLVRGQFAHYLTFGTEIGQRVGFNLHVPYVLPQINGENPFSEDVGQAGIVDSAATMGDLRIDARARLFETDDGRWRVGVMGAFTLATGSEAFFGGDPGESALLAMTGEYDFGPFFLAGHVGPHFKSRGEIGGSQGDLFTGNELRFAFGGYVPLRDDEVRLGLEIWGTTGMQERANQNTFFNKRNTTVEWLAQGRFLPFDNKRFYVNAGGGTRLTAGYGSADFRLMGSIGYWFTPDDFADQPPPRAEIRSKPDHYETDTDGDGWPDGIDPCPEEAEDGKEPEPSDGCPKLDDSDGDGIYDRWDKCPDVPEDKDGIQDRDGCPEEDADKDGVLDVEDACPEEVGLPSEDKEKNGCPQMTKVTADGTIALLKPIQFEFGKATIRPQSYGILDEVVALLKARAKVRLAIHGHTDTIGSREDNLKLSKDRAASVRQYLIDKGIDADRLESEGFGPDEPVATNETAKGRARNRRVEFILLEDGEKEKDQEAWTE